MSNVDLFEENETHTKLQQPEITVSIEISDLKYILVDGIIFHNSMYRAE